MSSDKHGVTQKLLLVNKLLDGRDGASPFTLVVDSLEQSARPLVREHIRRAQVSGSENARPAAAS